jgi:hypothetical protein
MSPDQLECAPFAPEVEPSPAGRTPVKTHRCRYILPPATGLEYEQHAVEQLVIWCDVFCFTNWLRQLRCQPVILRLRDKERSMFHEVPSFVSSNKRVPHFISSGYEVGRYEMGSMEIDFVDISSVHVLPEFLKEELPKLAEKDFSTQVQVMLSDNKE